MLANDCTVTELEHTAEIGLEVRAPTPGTLFVCLAHAMFALVGLTPDMTAPGATHRVHITAPDVESLLVDWLSELAYLHEVTGAVMHVDPVEDWTATSLTADVIAYPSTTAPTMHIKAVTYHDLSVRSDATGWAARVFFDI